MKNQSRGSKPLSEVSNLAHRPLDKILVVGTRYSNISIDHLNQLCLHIVNIIHYFTPCPEKSELLMEDFRTYQFHLLCFLPLP